MTSTNPADAVHQQLVQAAVLAPSVHNTQPWRFTSSAAGLDLWADPDRQLAVLDPDGRQLHVSCGAALLHARVAARVAGLTADPELLPDPADPTHLARLPLSPGEPATEAEQALAAAMPRRHTYREAFDPRPVPPALLDELRLTAERYAARLRPLTDQDDLLSLAALLSRADAVERADPAYLEELAAWVRTGSTDDGIPRAALPADPERGSPVALRDFAAEGVGGRPGGDPPIAEHPAIVLLLTDDDSPLSWLQAGMALGAVLLRAAQDGVLAQPLGQVTDLPEFRAHLGRALGVLGTPQIALRLGYAHTDAATPRRDVADVLRPAGS